MRLKDTIDYIGLWEMLNNPNFNRVEFDTLKKEYGRNSFVMTPSKMVTLIWLLLVGLEESIQLSF